MKYRIFPKTGEKISQLGFGAMRLPTLHDGSGKVDRAEAIRLIRHAIDCGVNYVDTAYVYHDGESEVIVGEALKDGYREKAFLATKLPLWSITSEADAEGILETQLKRLCTSHIDFYLAHSLDADKWEKFEEHGLFEFLKRKKAEGLIKKIGFSFHGLTLDLFKEIIDSHDWDFCQIQLNYMDANYQAGVEGLKYSALKGVPAVIMEPLKGGQLTDFVPDSVKKIWEGTGMDRTPADWAFRWVANFPEVLVILSGMHSYKQLEENLGILSEAGANCLTAEENRAIEKAAAEYNRLIPYPCTGCQYCLPCPQGLNIPERIAERNEAEIYQSAKKIGFTVRGFVRPLPSACVSCGECEEKCPQKLPIPRIMQECVEMFKIE